MADKVDLSLIGQADPSNKDYYLVKITGLKLDSNYDAKFQWSFQDQSLNNTVANIWSNSYHIVTNTETVPGAPSATVPSTSIGNIPVTLDSYPANAVRVNVYVIGGEFGTGKIADYFLAAGTKTISVVGGTYQVSLITVNQSGINGDPTNTFTINVSQPGETVQAPTNPNGFTSKRILAGIEVSWAGTYANSTFTGFEAINIYAGNSATATAGTYEQVGVLTGNNVKNTIVIPLGTYVVYGQPVYIHAAAVNRSNPPVVGTIQANVTNQPLGPGKATDADINDGAVVIEKLASNVLTVGNLKAGDINATSFIRAGSGNSGARVEISSANISGGPAAGFYIYNSAGAAVLSAPLSGGLSINGGGTFSGSLSAASGTFAGNISSSGGLFSVNNGVLTAQSGTIGGWDINLTQLRSTGSNYITLNPITPKISLVKTLADQFGGAGTLTIDPVEGIKDSAGNFKLTPAGNLTLKGSITSGSTITGATITVTNSVTSSGLRSASDSGLAESTDGSSGGSDSTSGNTTFNPTLTLADGKISSDSILQISGLSYTEILSGGTQSAMFDSAKSSLIFTTGLYLGNPNTSSSSEMQNHTAPYITVDGRMRLRRGAPLTYPSGTAGAYIRNIYIKQTTSTPSSTTGYVGDIFITY